MEKYIYYSRFVFPATGIMAVVTCFLLKASAPVTTIFIIAELLALLCADPFDMLIEILAPQTRNILTCVITVGTITGYAYYYCPILFDCTIPYEIAIFLGTLAILLLIIARKLNAQWLDRYQYLDCREVSCALVSDQNYKYIRFWKESGRRRCASLLNHHLHRRIEDEDMEHTIKHVFILGMACGDEYSSELLQENEELQEQLFAAENDLEKQEEKIDTIVKRRLAAQEEDLQDEITHLKKRNTTLSNLNADLKRQKSEAEKTLKTTRKQLVHLQGLYDQTQKDFSNLEKSISCIYEPQLKQLQAELNEVRSSQNAVLLEDLREENELMRSELQMVESKDRYITSLETEVSFLKKRLDEAIQKIDLLEESDNCHLAPVQTIPIRSEITSGQGSPAQNPKIFDQEIPATAVNNVNKGGRPASLTNTQLANLIQDRKSGLSISVLAQKYGISKATVSRLCSNAINTASTAEEQKKAL